MINYDVRLRRGAAIYGLNEPGRLETLDDFLPPETIETPMIASGNARADGRGSLVSNKPAMRSFAFEVLVTGDSGGEAQGIVAELKAFLNGAGDKAEPTFLEIRHRVGSIDPAWGQFGGVRRFEVLHGGVVANEQWQQAARVVLVRATVTLTLQPYAIGIEQRLCTATGGILEDVIGAADKRSRGVMVLDSTTNKFTNPVYGYATWNDGWTAGGNLIVGQNKDERWLIPGVTCSARLSAIAGTNNTFTQLINVGNNNAHSMGCLARLPDGEVVSSTQIQLYYNTALATTFTALGNGWYWLRAENFQGIANGTPAGVMVKSGYTVYVIAAMLEEKAMSTYPGWGDMLGWSWAGTAHASTSARSAAVCKLSTGSEIGTVPPVTLRCVFRTNKIPDGRDEYLFDLRDGSHPFAPYAFLASNGSRIIVVYNGFATQSAVLSANALYVMHVVISGSGYVMLYLNGVLSQSTAAGIAIFGVDLYIGSDYSGANQWPRTIHGLTLFNKAFSEAEVEADYEDVKPLVDAEKCVDAVPWLWTKDGDNVVDTLDDSTRDNWAVAGGIPGTKDAETFMALESALFHTVSAASYLAVARHALPVFINPAEATYMECSGTATGSYDSGSAVETISVSAAAFSDPANYGPDKNVYFNALAGREVYVLTSLLDAGTNLMARLRFQAGSIVILTDYKSIVPLDPVNCAAFLLGPINLPDFRNAFDRAPQIFTPLYICPELRRSTGGAANVSLDFYEILPRPLMLIGLNNNAGSIDGCEVNSIESEVYLTASGLKAGYAARMGDVLELSPNLYNVLLLNHVTSEAHAHSATIKITVKVIPRWAVM